MRGIEQHRGVAAAAKRLLGRYFYLAMALALAAIVTYGFGATIEANLFHPSFPRPRVLLVHAAVFYLWVLLLIGQSMLVTVRQVKWHRRLGWLGVGVGGLMPVLGVATALQMAHLRAGFGDGDSVAFLIVGLYDMAAFTTLFTLAVLWRRRPEVHRRLMLIATCGLSVAALTRFPPELVPENFAYLYVDGLIILCALRDAVVIKRVHPVYLWSLPLLITAQILANLIYVEAPPAWMAIAYWLIR